VESLKAMDFQAVGGEFVVSFAFGRQGASGEERRWRRRAAELVVCRHRRRRGRELPHVPFDIVGQYAKEDVV